MRKLLKAVLAAVLAGAMLFALCMPSQALNSVDCGTYIYKNPSYNKDGKFYMSFDIQAGRPPNTSAGYTSLVNAKLLNPSGQQVLSWGQVEVSPGARKTINYATSYSGRPHGTYTIAVTVTSRGNTIPAKRSATASRGDTPSTIREARRPITATVAAATIQRPRPRSVTTARRLYTPTAATATSSSSHIKTRMRNTPTWKSTIPRAIRWQAAGPPA